MSTAPSSAGIPSASLWQLGLTPGTVVTELDSLAQSIRILLTTEPYTDVMRPDFGIGLLGLIGQSIQDVRSALKRRGASQFASYIPQITVTDYRVSIPEPSLGKIEVLVVWKYSGATNTTVVTA